MSGRLRSVRWLLLKDLQILRRSPLTVAVLVLYPVVVALLVGLALSRGPDRPRVALVNQAPAGEEVRIGGERLDLAVAGKQLSRRVDVVNVRTRADAIRKVKGGDVLGAL